MSEQTLTCRDVVEIITDYLEDALSPGDRLRVEDHLRACPGCTNYLEQMREMIRLTRMVNEEEIPGETETAAPGCIPYLGQLRAIDAVLSFETA